MPDLSMLSDDDLKAISAGDLSKVSDVGLKALAVPDEGSRARAQKASAPILGDTLKAIAGGVGQGVGDAALGLQTWLGRGLKAVSPSGSSVSRAGDWLTNDAESGRARLAEQVRTEAGGDQHPIAAGIGRVSGQVAATLPVGALLGRGLSAAGAPEALSSAVSSAGMRTGASPVGLVQAAKDLGIRSLGGAINGGVSAAVVDPTASAAGAGAAVGAALPPVLKAGGAAVGLLGSAARELRDVASPTATTGARELARALEVDPANLPAVISQLRGAQTLMPGSRPTVAQALQSPQAGIVSRVVHDSPGGDALRNALQAQSQARMQALEGVAPIAADGAAQMRQDTGAAIARYAQAERGQASAFNRQQYKSVDPDGLGGVVLPADELKASAQKFMGAGSVGENAAPHQIAREAEALSRAPAQPQPFYPPVRDIPPAAPRASSWEEVMRMRASLNEQLNKAKNQGDRQAAAALEAQKSALDEAISKQLPPDMLARWQEANASRAAIGQRFDSGPQAQIFRTQNGQPVRQGGEVASLFWGNRPGLADDVKSFRKLVDDNPSLLGQFRSMVTTDGAEKAAAGGQLGQAFVKWARSSLPGLRELFEPAQVKALQNIADDIERASAAAVAGKGVGSNTYQNAANALDAGLLGSPTAKAVAGRIPYVRGLLEPMRAAGAESASKAKAQRLAGLLSDANEAAAALEAIQPGRTGRAMRGLMDMGDNAWTTALPGIGVPLRDLVLGGVYRGLPMATTGGAGRP